MPHTNQEQKHWEEIADAVLALLATGEMSLTRIGPKAEAKITIQLRNHPVCGGAVIELVSEGKIAAGWALPRRTFNQIIRYVGPNRRSA